VDLRRLVPMDEVLLEAEPALVCADLGPDRRVGHRQDRARDADGPLECQHDRGQGAALADPRGPCDVRREVPVAEAEPGLLAILGQGVHDGPGLAPDPPAALVVEAPGEHVHDRVMVRHDEQAVPFRVVARVDDDGQVAGRQGRLETVSELRAARPAGESDDPHEIIRPGARGPVPSGRSSRGRTGRASAR
jgi:hypothetical protein